jgi:hypothetical protein
MKFFRELLIAGGLLVATVQAEDKEKLDAEFQIAAEQSKVSVHEMIRRLQIIAPRLGRPDSDDQSFHFAAIFAAAVKQAQDAEMEPLEALLRKMPHDSFAFSDCFGVYATVRLRQRVAELARRPVHLSFPPSSEPLPPELATAPAADREAWALYNAVFAPYVAVVLPEEKMRPRRKDVPELELDLARVIGKPEAGAWKHLAEHVWGSWCGTGSEMLYHPRNRALLLSFLAEGKLQEAVGAALDQVPASLSDREPRFDAILLDLLTSLGLDWEKVMYGSLLPAKANERTGGRVEITHRFAEYDAWHLLATHGSDRAVRQCLDLIRRSNLRAPDAVEFLAAVLNTDPPQWVFTSKALPRGRKRALSPATHNEVLALVAEYLAPTREPADLRTALDALPPRCVKELRKPLDALLQHRLFPIASKAYTMLRNANLTTGEEKIVDAPPPLLIRLRLHGEALVNVSGTATAYAAHEPGDGQPPAFAALTSGMNFTTDTMVTSAIRSMIHSIRSASAACRSASGPRARPSANWKEFPGSIRQYRPSLRRTNGRGHGSTSGSQPKPARRRCTRSRCTRQTSR